jgi:hypothetical protein
MSFVQLLKSNDVERRTLKLTGRTIPNDSNIDILRGRRTRSTRGRGRTEKQ